MELPQADVADVDKLARVFENKSESYKLFWFQAIIEKVREGRSSFTFGELVDAMIAEAWPMVTQYHLRLGYRDALEAVCQYLAAHAELSPMSGREELLRLLRSLDGDSEVQRLRRQLILHVPYRFQAPFLGADGSFWTGGQKQLVAQINEVPHLMYTFGAFNGLNTFIEMADGWAEYIARNGAILEGWLKFYLADYLQKRNPSVPGILYKLSRPRLKKLEEVQAYWQALAKLGDVRDIYGHRKLAGQEMAIDHFVPWSFVAHDEFWNLQPTSRKAADSKGNRLPDWEAYFRPYADLAYVSYRAMWDSPAIHRLFLQCTRNYLHNEAIKKRLYRQGQSRSEFELQLEQVVGPVYQAALQCGFTEWKFSA